MKKSNYILLVVGIAGMLMFSLGMCMALVPEWNLLNQGICLGAAGGVMMLVNLLVYRKIKGAPKIKVNGKTVFIVAYSIFSCLVFGSGMALVLVMSEYMIAGILAGCAGILLFLGLIPLIKGLH